MPVLSLVSDIQADYMVAEGKPTIRLKSRGRIRHRAAFTGIATMLFHWVQQGKTQSWQFEPSIPEPHQVQPVESIDDDGNQTLTFALDELLPAAGLIRGRWEGSFLAPAVHIDVPMGTDVWVFLLRSPWFPLRLSIAKPTLSVAHEQSTAGAQVVVSEGGALSTSISSSGTSIKRVSLVVTRRVGSYSSEELVGEVDEAGTAAGYWHPVLRQFDLCLVTSSSMSLQKLSEIVRGLGGQFSAGFFGVGGLEGDYVLCDGPLTTYSLALKCDLGLLRHAEDASEMGLTW